MLPELTLIASPFSPSRLYLSKSDCFEPTA